MRKSRIAFLTICLLAATLSLVGFSPAQEKVDPVNWRELVPFLIDIPGYDAEGDAEGATTTMGSVKISQAERSYVSEEKELQIEIIDGANVSMVYQGFKMAMNFELDNSEEYLKKVKIKGFPGIEQYNYEDQEAKVIVLINDRFLMTFDGEKYPKDASELTKVAEMFDLNGMADLANK